MSRSPEDDAESLFSLETGPSIERGPDDDLLAPGSGESTPHDVPIYEIYVPVWGSVRLSPREARVVDHPAFQRLREINQLGFTHYVFPGATHRRYEHALGTMHAVTLMMEALERNATALRAKGSPSAFQGWVVDVDLTQPERMFTRLAALLHDVGHLAYGHTFEDELGLLPPHDANERLAYIFDKADWPGEATTTLRELLDDLYGDLAAEAGEDTAAELVLDLISKSRATVASTAKFRKRVCRDLVGNTLCADLLDYLHRDWHHIGKVRVPDMRILDYLEIRTNTSGRAGDETSRLVLNLRGADRVRTDAVTGVLDLLESRYQLAEIALFHRTKLNATAMLERVVAELASVAGMDSGYFESLLDDLLRCDDLEVLTLLENEADRFTASTKEPEQLEKLSAVKKLLGRIRRRQLHKLAIAVYPHGKSAVANQMRVFSGDPDSSLRSGAGAPAFSSGQARLDLARALEAQFDLQIGDLAIYCPRAKMNAKVAEVQVLLDDEVKTLALHESSSESNLTGGHLVAQTERFSRLWRMHIAASPEALAFLTENHLMTALDLTVQYVLGSSSRDHADLAVEIAHILRRTIPKYAELKVEVPTLVGARNQPFALSTFPNGRALITEYLKP
jgi:HD superfamily phosphohydrolase